MKKLITLILSLILTVGCTISVFAGDFNKNEQYIIEQITAESFPVKVEEQYVNQLKNYFYRDDVDIVKIDAEDFVNYLKEGMLAREELKNQGRTLDKFSDAYIKFQKAGTSIGLLFEYDSVINDFYAIDGRGYSVIDSQKIIKDTDSSSESDEEKNWNISIELIFAIVVVVCILGLVANMRRWNKKLKRKSNRDYDDDDDDDDELEVANRKTRKARLQTFSYKNVIQILRYFYVPIIMGVIIVLGGYIFINQYSDLRNSLNENFVNTQPVYMNEEEYEFSSQNIKAENQKKSININNISWPVYGEQYGILENKTLKIKAPVYFGDGSYLLEKGAGSYIGSSIPGADNTILIGAHDTTYFEGLENVKKKDIFTFTTTYGIYEYQVSKIKIFEEGEYDKAYNLNNDEEQLILYTCYPFGKLNGTKTQRMFVYLDKINGPSIDYQEVQ